MKKEKPAIESFRLKFFPIRVGSVHSALTGYVMLKMICELLHFLTHPLPANR